jgi:hypothetical protein
MNQLMDKLPIEIIYHIISYSYNIQPIDLRKDIISYSNTFTKISNIFNLKYRNVDLTNKYIYLSHLIFHLHCFSKGLQNLYSDCSNIISDLCNRNYIYKNGICNYNVISNVLNIHLPVLNVTFRSRIYWGLLNCLEREKFLNIHENIINN